MAHCSKTPAPTGEFEPQIIPDRTIQMIADRFARDDRFLAVYLFGSGARGAKRPDSDKEEYAAAPGLKSFTHIDAMTLNIERTCQAAIDAAMHLTAREHLGLPRNSADAFRLLHRAGLLSEETARAMVAMTGFRNIAIHEYRELDISVLHAVAAERWTSFVEFCRELGLTIRP